MAALVGIIVGRWWMLMILCGKNMFRYIYSSLPLSLFTHTHTHAHSFTSNFNCIPKFQLVKLIGASWDCAIQEMGVSYLWRAMQNIYKANGHWKASHCNWWRWVWKKLSCTLSSCTLKGECQWHRFTWMQQAPVSTAFGFRTQQEISQGNWEFKGD